MSPEGCKRFEQTESCLNKIEVIGRKPPRMAIARLQAPRDKL